MLKNIGDIMKRYSICVFPSLDGTPWETNSFILCVIYAMIRMVYKSGFELRIINNVTGEHYVY